MYQLENGYTRNNNIESLSGHIINPAKLRVATTEQVHYIDTKDLVRIQSMSNYSKLFFVNGKTMVVSKVLAHFDDLLKGGDFLRIHRTHLINLLYLKSYFQGSSTKISLSNDEELPVSRRKKKMLKQKMTSLTL